jgi:LDH2 family malate/lactate/ureidoglycolate dehydrogenase
VNAPDHPPGTTRRVRPERLAAFAGAVLASAGVPDADAAFVADCLVQAELWGHPSHGVLRLSWYVARIRSGVVDPTATPETVVDRGAVAVVDGHEALGHVVAAAAARDAVRRAAGHGVGVVAVRNSNHFGTSAHYTRMMAEAGCVGLLTTNSSPSMAPWGGQARTVGANPWSVAAPAGVNGVAVLDISNGNVARGKIYAARDRGVEIPAGWAIDAQGAPTTDPAAALSGLLLPMAGHKGYAIAFMMDVLSGVLTGSAFGTGVSGPQQAERRSGAGHLVLALEVAALLPLEEFNRRMERLITEVKSVPLAQDVDEVFYPGEIEDRSHARLQREGIELPAGTLADLERLARQAGLPLELADA